MSYFYWKVNHNSIDKLTATKLLNDKQKSTDTNALLKSTNPNELINDTHSIDMNLYNQMYSEAVNLSPLSKQLILGLNTEVDTEIIEPIYNITISRNKNNLVQSARIIGMPYNEEYRLMYMWDRVYIYYVDDNNVTYLIFKGYLIDMSSIDSIQSELVDFGVSGNLSAFIRKALPYSVGSSNNDLLSLKYWLQSCINAIGEYDNIKIADTNYTDFNVSKLTEINQEGDFSSKVKNIKDNYPIYITEDIDGNMRLSVPYYLWDTKDKTNSGTDINISVQENKMDIWASKLNSDLINLNNIISNRQAGIQKTYLTEMYTDMLRVYNIFCGILGSNADSVNKNSLILTSISKDVTVQNIKTSQAKSICNYVVDYRTQYNYLINSVGPMSGNYNPYENTQMLSSIAYMYNTMIEIYNYFNPIVLKAGTDIIYDIQTYPLNCWNIDYTQNVTNIRSNNEMGYVNCVIIIGKPNLDGTSFSIGVACDWFDWVINGQTPVVRVEYRYDISDVITLNQEAAKVLINEKSKYQVVVSINNFIPRIDVLDYARIVNYKDSRYDDMVFIVEDIQHSINSSNVNTVITLKNDHITAIPNSILTGKDAIAIGILSDDFINSLGGFSG